jgi:hypothetical protein
MYDICQTSADRACTLLLSRMVRRLVTNSRFDTFSLVLSKKNLYSILRRKIERSILLYAG